MSRKAVEEIVPQIKDCSWFFDTELLVLAEKQGYRIKDVPVAWVEDNDSRVKLIKTGWDDIKGIVRLRLVMESDAGCRDDREASSPESRNRNRQKGTSQCRSGGADRPNRTSPKRLTKRGTSSFSKL